MAISSMFSTQASPIAIDFGTASVKVLQIVPGDPPQLVAAAALDLPDAVRTDQAARFEYLGEHLPRLIRKARFKGRRATCSIPAAQAFVQHMQVPTAGGVDADEYIRTQLQIQTGYTAGNMVIRTVPVIERHREDGIVKETICFAIPRDVVMRQIDLLKRCRLEVAGVHTEQHAIAWAFAQLHRRRDDDQLTNLFIDLGWGSTKVGISHGTQLVFSKRIHIGGRHFDQLLAEALEGDLATARAHRLAQAEALPISGGTPSAGGATHQSSTSARASGAGAGGSAAPMTGGASDGASAAVAERGEGGASDALQTPGGDEGDADRTGAFIGPQGVDFTELIESIGDELAMCRRYHRALFEARSLDRLVFLGGEARHAALCRAVATGLDMPAVVGHPMAGLDFEGAAGVENVKLHEILPEWAVAYGLCVGAEQ